MVCLQFRECCFDRRVNGTVCDGADLGVTCLCFGGSGIGVGGMLEGREVVGGVFNLRHRSSLEILPWRSFYLGKDVIIGKIRHEALLVSRRGASEGRANRGSATMDAKVSTEPCRRGEILERILRTNVCWNLMEQGEQVVINPGDDVQVRFCVAGDIPLAEVDSAFGGINAINAWECGQLLPDGLRYCSGVLRGWIVLVIEGLWANSTERNVSMVFQEDILECKVFPLRLLVALGGD